MSKSVELVRGSGNVHADFGYPDADAEQLKALLAAQIIRILDERGLTVRKAHDVTGVAAADFTRIRKAKLDRFTVDRLMMILNRFDQKVEVRVKLRARKPELEPA